MERKEIAQPFTVLFAQNAFVSFQWLANALGLLKDVERQACRGHAAQHWADTLPTFYNADEDNIESHRLLNGICDFLEGICQWDISAELLADCQQAIHLLRALSQYIVDLDLLFVSHGVADGYGCLLGQCLHKGEIFSFKSLNSGVPKVDQAHRRVLVKDGHNQCGSRVGPHTDSTRFLERIGHNPCLTTLSHLQGNAFLIRVQQQLFYGCLFLSRVPMSNT